MLKILLQVGMFLVCLHQQVYAQDYNQFDPELTFGNKCIEIDGMYMNFYKVEIEAYASPMNGGKIIKGRVDGFNRYCFVRFKSVKLEGRRVDITYQIERRTFKYEKEVVTRTTYGDMAEETEALKQGIPLQKKFPDRETFNGKWKFIPCSGRK